MDANGCPRDSDSDGDGGSGDGGPETGAVIYAPQTVAAAPDGSVYTVSSVVRKVTPVFPRFDGGSILQASEDGSEVYVFDPVGRHRRTVHALTGAPSTKSRRYHSTDPKFWK